MRTFYNPQTMTTYFLKENGEIGGVVNKNYRKCTRCSEVKEIVQNGIYAGLCQKCRRKQYYLNNKERENAKCRENYHSQNGHKRMMERRYGGNRSAVIKRDKLCQKCGGLEKLQIHHIDVTGMKSVGSYKKSNNNLDNLVLLCASCHSNFHLLRRYKFKNLSINDFIRL